MIHSRFPSLFTKNLKSRSNKKHRQIAQRRRLLVQPLEDRRVLALLGVTPDFPIIAANSTGSIQYDASVDTFTADAVPLSFQESFFSFASAIGPPATFDLQFRVNDSGALIGGVPGDDFTLTGTFDIDFDNIPDVSGVLLTGEVTGFGFADGSPTSTDSYDLRLQVTGGALASAGTLSGGGIRPAYFDGFDIGLLINSENSTFTGNFNNNFSGGNKASLGPIEADVPPPPVLVNLGDYVWYDNNYNGLQDGTETGVVGVTVNLYQDTDGDGVAEPNGDDGPAIATQVTDANGYYLFTDLTAGDYFVEFDTATLPAGYQLTTQNAGSNNAIDSDANQVTGLTAIINLADVDDLTWDAGINLVVHPAIQIVKYVDKIVETSECVTIDFDSLAKGTIVSTQYPGVVINGKSNSRPTAGNAAMIFNSASPTGGDTDLGTPNIAFGGPGQGSGGASNTTALGKVLILSEDGDSSDPDDDARGGYFTFDFTDGPVTINHLDVLDIDTDEAGGSIITFTTSSGTQSISIPTAGNNSVQRINVNVADVTSMKVKFVSSGAITELKYSTFDSQKQWFDANEAPGVEFEINEVVEFSYHVTNPGDVELVPVVVVDDNATPGVPGDDFNPTPVLTVGGFNQGDTDEDGRLDPNEEWIYTAEIIATVAGQFTNIGKVTGTPVNPNGDVIGEDVMDDDPANYVVNGVPGIDIEKLTNGEQADLASEAVEIAPGASVTWTYLVTNTGTTTFLESEVVVVDDAGTPLNNSDDFSPTLLASSDVGGDGKLSPGEVWEYTYTDTAEAVTSSGQSATILLDGNSALDGTNGNVRSYSAAGVNVSATAFSRDSSGVFQTAFLGAYSGGLGVTDNSEGNGGNGTHRVDNIGRLNYVVFQFSESVVVDAAFLDSVVTDSDLSIWIGNASGPITLSDAFLAGLAYSETNDTTSSASRWADFNASGASGNVLVLAASVVDDTPEDQFKIRKLTFGTIAQGVYKNVGTVNAGTETDSDPSHYTNPAPQASGVIGDYVWNDLDRDGKQDSNESGVSGVTVKLYNDGGSVIATTITASNGAYEFTGLQAGNYQVGFVLPNDYVFTQQRSDISDAIDSDADRTTGKSHVIVLSEHEIDRTIDAGIYQAAVDVMFEAEHYEWLDHPWQVKSDSAASGGKYLVANNGSGSCYNAPPSHSKVMYRFNTEVAGNYELSSRIKAANGADNSVWYRVDGGNWMEWHTPITGNNYEWHATTSGWDQAPVTFSLGAGSHTLELKVREDGLKLDKFMVSKLANNTVVLDAMDTVSRTGDWTIDVDDDGNEFLVAANGTGTFYNAPPKSDTLTYNFSLAEGGMFEMYALVSAANGDDNSLWIQIDGGAWIEWHLDVTGDSFEWQNVTNGASQSNVDFQLAAGNHTLKIKVREDGTKLDKIVITDNQFIDLSGY